MSDTEGQLEECELPSYMTSYISAQWKYRVEIYVLLFSVLGCMHLNY